MMVIAYGVDWRGLMTIFELGALGEFAGAILLFGSLIYVGLQIRQNTNATRAAIYQDRAALVEQQFMEVAKSAELAQLLDHFDLGTNLDLTPVERRRLHAFFTASVTRLDNLFYQYQLGFLDAEFYEHRYPEIIQSLEPVWKALEIAPPRPSFKTDIDRILTAGTNQ